VVLRRRALAFLLVILAAPLAAEAQRAERVFRIGVLSPEAEPPGLRDAFTEGLRGLGYVDGKNLTIDWRQAGGRNERLATLAAEFVRIKVDVIVAVNTPAARAAKNATTVVPIVITRVSDPVKTGLVLSFSHPGANITGWSFQPEETSVKRLQLLKEALPAVSRVAALWYTGNQGPGLTVQAIEPASEPLGIRILRLPVSDPGDLLGAFQVAARDRAQALFVVDDVYLTKHRAQILELATKHALPVISQYREFAEIGGLMAYGPSAHGMYRDTAYYVDKILKGARPADLPIQQPTKFELVINAKTARALGLTIPRSILTRADQVIE
jgi:putative ABC transport system substrate-binding protein